MNDKYNLFDGTEFTEGEFALNYIKVTGQEKEYDLFKKALTEGLK